MINPKKHSVLLTLTLLMATVTISSAYITVPTTAQVSSDWPMFKHDPARTGFNPTSTAPAPFKYGWIYTTQGPVRSSPAVVGGKVYIGSDDTYLYCLNGATGSLNWKYQTGGAVASSPAVIAGKVYFGSFDNYVYCLDANSGNLVWKHKTGYYVYSSPCVVDGRLYIASNDKLIYCLNATSGNLIWNFTTRGVFTTLNEVPGDVANRYYSSSAAVVGGKVFIGSFDNFVYCLDGTTGAKIWEFECGAAPPDSQVPGGVWESTPCVANDTVYIGAFDYHLYALNSTTGQLVWKYIQPTPQFYQYWIQTSPAIAYGKLYVTWPSHTTCAHDPATGTQLWAGRMGTLVRSSPSVADGKVYNGDNDRYFYCWNANTGQRLQSEPTASGLLSSPAIADGNVYMGGMDSNVYCYQSGHMQSQNTLGITVQPKSVSLGSSVTVSGGINSFHGYGPSGQQITLTYVKPEGAIVTRAVTTGDLSVYSDTFAPDTQGEWKVKASWQGNPDWLPAQSWYEYFTVTAAVSKTSTTTGIIGTTYPNGTAIVGSIPQGQPVTIRGAIRPAILGAKVTLTYTMPNSTTITRTVTSEAQGLFTDNFTPEAEGNWNVTASYAGSDTYSGSTSSAASFSIAAVTTATAIQTEVVLAIIAIVVIAIVLVAAYLYTRRKK